MAKKSAAVSLEADFAFFAQLRLVYEQNQRGYLEGLCGRSGLIKTYRIDRVHKVLP